MFLQTIRHACSALMSLTREPDIAAKAGDIDGHPGDQSVATVAEPDLPRLITVKDGINVPEHFEEYVVILAVENHVTVYVEDKRASEPPVDSIRISLERRTGQYKTIEFVACPMEEIQRKRRAYDEGATNTTSHERRAVDLLRFCKRLGATDVTLKQYRESAGVNVRINGDIVSRVKTFTKDEIVDICRTLWNMSDESTRVGDYSKYAKTTTGIVDNLKKYGLDEDFAAIRPSFKLGFLGPEAFLRLQPATKTARPIEEIGLAPVALTTFRRATRTGSGAILVSGPVGSGKTNLLASGVLDYHLRHPEKSILTIEDPVELFIAENISQWFVTGKDMDRLAEYMELLNSAVRSDAQLLMVQELRDSPAAKTFFQAANTGALGLTTIHTPTAPRIILRLREWGIERVILTDPEMMRLLGAVRLVKVLCPDCKVPIEEALADRDTHHGDKYPELKESVARLQRHANQAFRLREANPPSVVAGFTRNHQGCPTCRGEDHTPDNSYGTSGRTQLAEFIAPSATLLEHLYEGRVEIARKHLRAELRVPSIQEDAIERIAMGQICPLDVEASMGEFADPRHFELTDVLEPSP